MIQIIKPDNEVGLITTVNGEPTLEELYQWIGCDTIEVPGGEGFMVEGELMQFVMDEEGKLKGKPYNITATQRYNEALKANGLVTGRDYLAGTVVILTGPNLLK